MIYTVNLNSSLDYIMRVGHFRVGETNRAERDSLVAGGKGVNVAKVLRAFGLPVKAFVVTAGFVGAEIERQLSAEGMDCAFFRTSGNSRINVKLKSDAETEINGRGEGVPDETVEDIAAALTPSPDWLVLSGNAPSGTRSDVYRRLASAAGGAAGSADAEVCAARSLACRAAANCPSSTSSTNLFLAVPAGTLIFSSLAS